MRFANSLRQQYNDVGAAIVAGKCSGKSSSKAEYAWEMFDWEDEDEFYSWLDNLGIVAMCYVVAGFVFAMQRVDTEELVWGLMAVYLSGIGLQGFREDTERERLLRVPDRGQQIFHVKTHNCTERKRIARKGKVRIRLHGSSGNGGNAPADHADLCLFKHF